MKRLSYALLICLLVLHAVGPALADNQQPSSLSKYANVDIDTGEYVLVGAVLVTVVGGTIWYFVKRSQKPREKDKARVTSVSRKPKLDLHLDMVPVRRSLASPDMDIDYRVGLTIRF